MEVKIYNRWGQLIYTSQDPNFEWDGTFENGKECGEGVYLVIMDGTLVALTMLMVTELQIQ